MIRSILGVIVGYIAMFIVVAAGLSIAYIALGPDWAYQEGTYEITMKWAVLMLAVGLVAALLGGAVCALISKHSRNAVLALMALIVVLGGVSAAYQFTKDPPEDITRAEDDSVTDAASKARQPAWTQIANPIIGAVGVMLGATLVCPRHGPGASKSESAGEG